MRRLEQAGYTCSHDPEVPRGDIAVINTCSFIADAKEESINTILQFAQAKAEGRLSKLFVMGCLPQRYRHELEREIPQVDKYYGKFDYKQLVDDLRPRACTAAQTVVGRTVTTGHYAYVKISEGCDRRCSYCAIPLITGRQKSRPPEEILAEVRALVAQGVKELIVVAQELTSYGTDLDGRQHIARLVSDMADIDGVEWIRLHYAYPTRFPMDLLSVIRDRPNVCKYIDIALQHISDPILRAMHRDISKAETVDLISRIREEVPGIHLRTTLMVGFPGETEARFDELMQFTRDMRFECMGAFAYSEEDGTYSARHYTDDVPDDVKQQRLSRLMALQQDISAEVLAAMVGRTERVIIDRREGSYYVGRTQYSSPEVDPEVLVGADNKHGADSTRLRIGEFYDVAITGSTEFDLYATPLVN